ncbi:MAG: glycerate kinase [Clostridiales bacterium]|nr:glycerate kinase [Clostridiales bacterium]
MKVTVAMDSFKGSLTSVEAGEAVKRGILKVCPGAEVMVLPLADGGEGTLDCIKPYIGGEEICLKVKGPLGDPIDSSYIYDRENATAYIEMAKASGLTLIAEEKRDPRLTTSYGTGELIRDAAEKGAERLFVFIGGSATNDGGAGMLQALGVKLLDSEGKEIRQGAIGLKDLACVDLSGLAAVDLTGIDIGVLSGLTESELSDLAGRNLEITVASDVINPLCGPDGASFVYGPQKGASEEACKEMDGWLERFAGISGFDPFEAGTGAAGGMSFALKNFLGAQITSGAETVTGITDAEAKISGSDIVITGEGRMDSQTVNGKAPFRILELGLEYGKPVHGICGILGDGSDECLKAGFRSVNPLAVPVMEREKAIKSVEDTAEALFSHIM